MACARTGQCSGQESIQTCGVCRDPVQLGSGDKSNFLGGNAVGVVGAYWGVAGQEEIQGHGDLHRCSDSGVAVKEPSSLWKVCAENAFWRLDLSSLKWLADSMKVKPRANSEVGFLHALCANALPDKTDTDIMDIISTRLQVPNDFDEIIQEEGLEDALHSADGEELQNERRQAQARTKVFRTFNTEFREHRAQSLGGSASATRQGRRLDWNHLKSDIEGSDVSKHLPPQWSMSCDGVNGRWQLWVSKDQK